MPIYKRCSRCGRRLKAQERCPCYARRYDDDKPDERWRAFYLSAGWGKARAAAIARCQGIDWLEYLQTGRLVPGDTVHHIIPLKEDWSLRLSADNLIYLTSSNHQLVHKELSAGGRRREAVIELCRRALEASQQ